eukprot:13252492-Alexandrium_andersonii.AAC.1
MHTDHLGVGMQACACWLVELCGGRLCTMPEFDARLLTLWEEFNAWMSATRQNASIPLFTHRTLTVDSTTSFPCLASCFKAAH